jgi:hypothetical protein
MSFVVQFANGDRVEGQSVDDARLCIDAVRKTNRAVTLLPAQIWEVAGATRTTKGFTIGGSRLIEEHLSSGVIVPEPAPPMGAGQQEERLPRDVSLRSLGVQPGWAVEARLEEWVSFAGRDDYAWAAVSKPIPIPLVPGSPLINTRRVLVAARHPGWDLRTITRPAHVHVCMPATGAISGNTFAPGDIMTSVWAIASTTQVG